jgi:hypothetical protein
LIPSTMLAFTATGWTATGSKRVSVFSDADCTTALAANSVAFAAAATAYVKLDQGRGSKVSLPKVPVGVDLEFFNGSASNGKLSGLEAGDNVDWDADYTLIKVTTAAGLGTDTLQIWVV